MARFTFPRLFELEIASAISTRDKQTFAKHINKDLLKEIALKIDFPQEWSAVALRWRLSPFLGIPLQPFNVYRRISDGKKHYKKLGINKTTLHNGFLSLNSNVFYDVTFSVSNNFASPATIFALDDNQNEIPGEQIVVPIGVNTLVRFRAPNIAFIKVVNSITIADFKGISMNEMVNLNDWKLIEKVGLPYIKGEVANNIYDTTVMQGRIANPLEGDAACKFRVNLGRLFFQAPPTTNAGISISAFNTPKGNEVYKEIVDGNESLLNLLSEMFKITSQGSFNNRQIDHLTQIKGKGIHQGATGASTEDSTFEIPLAGTTMLSASMDMWASLGLGFGSTDIVDDNKVVQNKYLEPNRFLRAPYDYMVSSQFILPGRMKREFAALSRFNPTQDAFQTPLAIVDHSENRPINRDAQYSEDLELKWLRIPAKLLPSSYIFARSDDGINAKILNEKRPFTSNSYYGFVPAVNPEQDATHQLVASYIDQMNKNPNSGSRTLTYFKVATDVFGRWSPWVSKTHLLESKAPHMPALLKVDFKLDPTVAIGKVIVGDLEIEIAWDWEDRSPDAIQIAGKFIAPTIAPSTTAPSGFQKSANAGMGSIIEISFNSNNLNHIPSVSSGATVKKLPHTPEDGQNRKYLVTVHNISVDFGLMNRHGFAAYARASESVNPTLFSDYCSPKKGQTNNPLPAEPISIIGPNINWTALPDATGFARYEFELTTIINNTIGYIIYEATELALRDAIGLPTLNSNDITVRATDLINNKTNVRAKDAFIRKNKKLLTEPKITLNLPASASGLYVYCISSVTSEQVESEKSNWLLVAVPQRTTPAPPILSATNVIGGVQLSVEPYGSTPSRSIELYRTRSELLVTDIDVMGRPIAYDNDVRWTKLDSDKNPVLDASEFPAVYKLTDNVKKSWLPYYYRAAAFGEHMESNGILKGKSKSSNLIKINALPTSPPDLTDLSVTKSGGKLKVSFKSKAERWKCPLGMHNLQLLTIDRSAIAFEEVLKIESRLPTIEEKTSSSSSTGEFKRVSLDADGRWLYECFIEKTTHEIIVRLFDPKFRKSELRTKYKEVSVPLKLDIVSLIAKRNAKRLKVTFKSRTPVIKPLRGAFLLEIFEFVGRGSVSLIKSKIHEIKLDRTIIPLGPRPNIFANDLTIAPPIRTNFTIRGRRPRLNIPSIGKATIVRSARKDSKGRYTYTATIPNKLLINNIIRLRNKVIVKITSPKKKKFVQKEKFITKD